jgi:hypothetical protein
MTGLIGSHGILPIADFLPRARNTLGPDAYHLLPTLLWLWSGDTALALFCWAGAALSLVLIAGFAPVPTSALLWVLYLSLTVAGQVFLEFQWDLLLLETGLLACLYAPIRAAASEPNPIVRWVLWGLAFKLTFLSGITKILSGDPTWADWTAMTYHYQTQPIPAPTSWYAHQSSAPILYWSVPAMLAIELVVPFVIALPARFRKTRFVACALMILLRSPSARPETRLLQLAPSIVLYLALLDDQTLRPGRRAIARGREKPVLPSPTV